VTSEQIFLMARERALGGDKQLMMVRDARYHGYMVGNVLLQQFAQAAARVQRPRIAVPDVTAVRPGSKGRRRR
jgi:hypothetical protein